MISPTEQRSTSTEQGTAPSRVLGALALQGQEGVVQAYRTTQPPLHERTEELARALQTSLDMRQ